MGKFTFHPVKSLQSDPKLRMLCLFGIEGFLHVRVHFLAAQRCNCAVTVGVRQPSCRQVQLSAQCRKLLFLRSVFNMV